MKKRLFATGIGAAALTLSSLAFPCGGMFGPNATVDASQQLVVAHKAGTETYVFRPHFCGEAAQFGLILPVPASLSAQPKLGNPAIFEELAKLAAPEVKTKTICKNDPALLDAGARAGGGQNGGEPTDGANVIQKGQVGIFDWSLIKADSKESFTQWLDANGFPHAAAADDQFAHYVTEGWYFVAFKVTAGDNAPPAGQKLCGDFGPIELAFPAAAPVVPTRIAQVSANGRSPQWRIFGITEGSTQLSVSSTNYPAITSFSGTLADKELASYPELTKLGAPGDRIVQLDVGFAFGGLDKDLVLTPAAGKDYRRTEERLDIVDCPTTTPTTPTSPEPTGINPEKTDDGSGSSSSSGCNAGAGHSADFALGGIGVALAIAMLARRRRS